MSWSEVWSNSSTFLNIHCADFKSILLMQIFRGGKRPVIPVNHQCHRVIAFLPYRESPVCGYTWVVKDTSFVFSNHMGYLYTISKWPWWWEGRNNNNNKNNKCYCSCCYSVTKSCFLFVIPWTAAHHGSLPFTIFQSLRKLCPISQWCYLTISSSTSPFTFCIQSFQAFESFPKWVSFSHQLAKVLSFSFSISPSNKYSGLISFRIEWFDLLAVQRTFKSFLQHHNLKASTSALSLLYGPTLISVYMTTGKTIALIVLTLTSKAMSLLFNTLSRLIIAFLSRSK